MKYILVALKDELPDHDLDSSEYQVWYTGVGKINATMWATMACIQHDCETVINYGTAGSLNNELVDKLVQVGQVKQRDMDARPVSALGVTPFEELGTPGTIVIGTSPHTLSTGDNFVKEKPELESDIVDMEAYAIAKVCKHFAKNLLCYKYVTDSADESAAEHWKENCGKGADAFLSIT